MIQVGLMNYSIGIERKIEYMKRARVHRLPFIINHFLHLCVFCVPQCPSCLSLFVPLCKLFRSNNKNKQSSQLSVFAVHGCSVYSVAASVETTRLLDFCWSGNEQHVGEGDATDSIFSFVTGCYTSSVLCNDSFRSRAQVAQTWEG